MKIIRTSKYQYEDYRGDERVVARELSQAMAKIVCVVYQNSPDRSDGDWYEVVPDNHKLREFKQ